MFYNDLDKCELELIKKQQAKEDEIKGIYRVISDEMLSRSLLSGREFWIKRYNKKKAEYEAFCIKHRMLRRTLFPKIIE